MGACESIPFLIGMVIGLISCRSCAGTGYHFGNNSDKSTDKVILGGQHLGKGSGYCWQQATGQQCFPYWIVRKFWSRVWSFMVHSLCWNPNHCFRFCYENTWNHGSWQNMIRARGDSEASGVDLSVCSGLHGKTMSTYDETDFFQLPGHKAPQLVTPTPVHSLWKFQ